MVSSGISCWMTRWTLKCGTCSTNLIVYAPCWEARSKRRACAHIFSHTLMCMTLSPLSSCQRCLSCSMGQCMPLLARWSSMRKLWWEMITLFPIIYVSCYAVVDEWCLGKAKRFLTSHIYFRHPLMSQLLALWCIAQSPHHCSRSRCNWQISSITWWRTMSVSWTRSPFSPAECR